MLGRSFSYIQIISPLLALYGFMTKVVLSPFFTSEEEEWNKERKTMQFVNIACLLFILLPLFLFAIFLMSFGGREADYCKDGPLFDV